MVQLRGLSCSGSMAADEFRVVHVTRATVGFRTIASFGRLDDDSR
jgi:hypothetical protein